MKKSVAFIMAILYLGLTSGLAVNIHYCMGKIADVRLDDFHQDPCNGGKQKMPCCKHEFQLVKVNDAHQLAVADFSVETPAIDLHHSLYVLALAILDNNLTSSEQANSPPLLTPPDIYLQNCVFRI